MTHKELMIESDMLQGNINRMIVTKDQAELVRMFWFAMKRLHKIYDEKIRELSKDKEVEE